MPTSEVGQIDSVLKDRAEVLDDKDQLPHYKPRSNRIPRECAARSLKGLVVSMFWPALGQRGRHAPDKPIEKCKG